MRIGIKLLPIPAVKICFLTVIFLAACFCSFSQKRRNREDTLAVYKKFISICNAYKELPLQAQISIHNTADIPLSKEDTLSMETDFYLQPDGTYIKFGGTEELVNDSLLVVVSHQTKRMMLYKNANSAVQQMNYYMKMLSQDSSSVKLSQKFMVNNSSADNPQSHILLVSRANLPGTVSVPKETIELNYNPLNSIPETIIYVNKSLIPIAGFGADSIKTADHFKEKTVDIDGSSFIINEKTSVYRFSSIRHEKNARLPVQMEERIIKNDKGNYQVAKGFEDYLIRQSF